MILSPAELFFTSCLNHYGSDGTGKLAAEEFPLRRCQRNEEDIILVPALRRPAFSVHNPDNHEGKLLDPHDLADGVFRSKQVFGNSTTDEAVLCCPFHIRVADDSSRYSPPIPYGKIVRGYSHYRCGPVHISVYDLCSSPDNRRRERNGRTFRSYGLCVVMGKGWRASVTHSKTAACSRTRQDKENITAYASYLIRDYLARP